MNILFVHQNFPAQYLHLSARLASEGHRVVAITQHRNAMPEGVQRCTYAAEGPAHGTHPYLADLDSAVRRGLAVVQECERLARGGFRPDIVIGHTGWGETLYIKTVWPHVPVLGYFEFFYRATGSDMDFDAEFPPPPDSAARLQTRNAINLLSLEAADWGITPTRWQRDQFPPRHRDRMSIIHEGIDTQIVRPAPAAQAWLSGGRCFSTGDEIITFSARNLEPYRGFHVFMRALPRILRQRPNAHCLILGGDGISYGSPPPGGGSWRDTMLAELGSELDLDRVHILGTLPFQQYLAVLQLSAVHVYLTYPFVLSWSLLEALAAGCQVVASRTPPVEEAITDGQNGILVDFFDTDAIAEAVCDALRGGDSARRRREAARESVIQRYDLRTICLPAQLALLHHLMGNVRQTPRLQSAPARHNRGIAA